MSNIPLYAAFRKTDPLRWRYFSVIVCAYVLAALDFSKMTCFGPQTSFGVAFQS